MKIAIIAPSYIPSRRANTLQVMKMAQALCILGHTVRLAVPDDNFLSARVSHQWSELARHYGLHCEFPIDWLPSLPRLRRHDFSLRAVRWARQWQANLIYTRLPQAAALASFLGVSTVFEIHDLPQGLLGPRMFRCFLRGKGARRLVAITHALLQDLSRLSRTPLGVPFALVAPDGVDLVRYVDLPEPCQARQQLAESGCVNPPLTIHPERFTVGFTGHLYPGRGSELLLGLASRLPGMTFLIAGGEPQDVAQLQAEALAMNMENVILTGFIPNADLPRFQAACDVLLMPYQIRVAASSGGDISRYLSPMKLFEYMACQRVIVSGDLPVLREVLNSGNSILLPMDNEDNWVHTLQDLQDNPELRSRLAAQARRDAERYTWEARAEMIFGGV